jgi:hypothetical protein
MAATVEMRRGALGLGRPARRHRHKKNKNPQKEKGRKNRVPFLDGSMTL